jgi:PAS domain S-box-containing protein
MMSTEMDFPEELQSLSGEFYHAVNKIDIYWWFWNIKDRLLSVSPGYVELLGYTKENFDPSVPTFDKNIHPDDAQGNRQKLEQLISGNIDLYEQEYRLRSKDGEWKWYYSRGNIIKR